MSPGLCGTSIAAFGLWWLKERKKKTKIESPIVIIGRCRIPIPSGEPYAYLESATGIQASSVYEYNFGR